MSIEEIFIELVSHMKKGLSLHEQLIHLYGFLNLKGYAKQQEHQYFEQSQSYIQIKNFYLQQYGKMLQEKIIQPFVLIPESWYKYDKFEVDSGTKRKTIRQLFHEWLKWEEDTKVFLNNCYKQLYELKEFYSCDKILKLLSNLHQQISTLKDELNNLESTGYDMVFILENQQHLYNGGDS